MLSYLRSLKKHLSKGQFYVISAILLVSILISIQGYFAGYSKSDFTLPLKHSESYFFLNFRQEIQEIVDNPKPCENVKKRLVEFKTFTEKKAREIGYDLNIEYLQLPPCPSRKTIVSMNLTSSTTEIKSVFVVR